MRIFIAIVAVVLVFSNRVLSHSIHKHKEHDNDKKANKPTLAEAFEGWNAFQVEGDMKISQQVKYEQAKLEEDRFSRSAIRNYTQLWTDKIVPYEIDSNFMSIKPELDEAIKGFHKFTCLRFVERTTEKNWIKYVKLRGCWSHVGRQYQTAGFQLISIGEPYCQNRMVITHETMHALGFWHEHSRPDRDNYVQVFWENFIPAMMPIINVGYMVNTLQQANTMGTNYDYYSVMHYTAALWSRNGRFTMTAIGDKEDKKKIGPSLSNKWMLSPSDVLRVKILYQCQADCPMTSLGAEDGGSLPDSSFTASSIYNQYKASKGRLTGSLAWCAANTGSPGEYLQIDLGKSEYVCSVKTQGSVGLSAWVKEFTMEYSDNGKAWHEVVEYGTKKVLIGNKDTNTVKSIRLPVNIQARYLRFHPTKVEKQACMRVGLYGGTPFKDYSTWSPWAPCDLSSKTRRRQRFCTAPNITADCPKVDAHGVQSEFKNCTLQEINAPIDGHWSRWSPWGPCNASCGTGKHTRRRKCNMPDPKNNGKQCVGSGNKTADCIDKFCNMGPIGCSFTKNFCGWIPDPALSDIPWTRYDGKSIIPKTGPERDHTAPDDSGYYIKLDALRYPPFSQAVLRSPAQAGNQTRCLKFYYHMYGKGMGTLNVTLQDMVEPTEAMLFRIKGDQGDKWHFKNITFINRNDFMIRIYGVVGDEKTTEMAVDDVSLLWGPCQKATATNPEPNKTPNVPNIMDFDYSEDFENPKQDIWEEATDDDFDWIRRTGQTPTPFTGPSGDHTKTIGYYKYMEASNRSPKQRARLITKMVFDARKYKCLSFFYNMNGKDVWQLNVFKRPANQSALERYNGTTEDILVWSANKNTNDIWVHALAPIGDPYNKPNKIIIEAVRGYGDQGDIAIDDIVLGKHYCSEHKPMSSRPWGSYTQNGQSTTCSFDPSENQCSFIDLDKGKFRWSHTLGLSTNHTGSYMYIDSSPPRVKGDKAYLATYYWYYSNGYYDFCKKEQKALPFCVSFRYLMNGTGMGELSVYHQRSNLYNQITNTFPLLKLDQGSTWKYIAKKFVWQGLSRFVFEATVGTPGQSNIAIDDIAITPNCPAGARQVQ